MIYRFGKNEYDLSSRTFIMGILNITPDSFSDGGKYFNLNADTDTIIREAIKMESDGADFIDVGGESTRPGARKISPKEEIRRVIPVIEALVNILNIPVSIDTYKHQVAEEAFKAGAVIVNDISGFRFDAKIAEVTARHNASCILMHIKGTPLDMQTDPFYNDVVKEVTNCLTESVKIAERAGLKQIIVDPGIGFGKLFGHNVTLIQNLNHIRKETGCPLLLGVSRKSFLNHIYKSEPCERLEGTIAANTAGIFYGANIIRVHDVLENKRAALTADILNIRHTPDNE